MAKNFDPLGPDVILCERLTGILAPILKAKYRPRVVVSLDRQSDLECFSIWLSKVVTVVRYSTFVAQIRYIPNPADGGGSYTCTVEEHDRERWTSQAQTAQEAIELIEAALKEIRSAAQTARDSRLVSYRPQRAEAAA